MSGNILLRNILDLRIETNEKRVLASQFTDVRKYLSEKYLENLMKKISADITMRGRPEREEMLQLEAAMSASYSHKPPSFLLKQQF